MPSETPVSRGPSPPTSSNLPVDPSPSPPGRMDPHPVGAGHRPVIRDEAAPTSSIPMSNVGPPPVYHQGVAMPQQIPTPVGYPWHHPPMMNLPPGGYVPGQPAWYPPPWVPPGPWHGNGYPPPPMHPPVYAGYGPPPPNHGSVGRQGITTPVDPVGKPLIRSVYCTQRVIGCPSKRRRLLPVT